MLKSFLLSAALLLTTSTMALAQPGSGGPGPDTPTGPTDTSLDGAASLLLAGGVGYAVRKLRQRRQKQLPANSHRWTAFAKPQLP